MILWLLTKKNMHGQQLAKEIGKKRGDKPKAGTLYPALKDLREKGLIAGKKKGTTITYSLTAEGKKESKMAMDYFIRCFGEIMEKK